MKTPLQELIEAIKEFRDNESSPLVISRLNQVLLKAASLLKKEEEQIMDAFKNGVIDECIGSNKTPEQYYNENFNTNEK